MTPALPLADAATRLRGKPGRPRTTLVRAPRLPRAEVSETPARPADPPEMRAPDAPVANVWRFDPPRVLTLEAAAAYLSVSSWTLRELRQAGHVPALEIPGVRALRFDRAALDAVVSAWSARASTEEPA